MQRPMNAVLFVAVSAALLISCQQKNPEDFAIVSIGPSGGVVMTPDGFVVMTVPAGAVAEPRQFGVEYLPPMDSTIDTRLDDPGFEENVRLTIPDGLITPVTLEITQHTQESDAGKIFLKIPVGVPPGLSPNDEITPINDVVITRDVARNTTKYRFTVPPGIDEVAIFNASSELCASLVYPPTLPVGNSDDITLNVEHSAMSNITSLGLSSTWSVVPDLAAPFTIQPVQMAPFAGGAILVSGIPQNLTDSTPVLCGTAGTGTFTVSFVPSPLNLSQIFPSLPFPNASTLFMRFDFLGAITCTSTGTGPTSFIFVPTGISLVESVRPAPPGLPFATTTSNVPSVLCAGQGGAVLVDPTNGNILNSYTVSGFDFFDANFIPGPLGASSPLTGLYLSGVTGAAQTIDTVTGATSGLTQLFPSSVIYQDQTAIGGSTSNGVLGIRSTDLFAYTFNGTTLTTNPLASNFQQNFTFRSAVAESTAQRILAATQTIGGSTGNLVLIDRSQTPTTFTTIGPLGDTPRRIRWDPSSGIGCVSNFGSDSVTIFTWNGGSSAAITATTPCADGPVGVDVEGTTILAPGFFDNRLTVIQTNTAGAVTSSTTTPLPSAIVSPGHATFLGTPTHSFVVSGNASNNVAYFAGLTGFVP